MRYALLGILGGFFFAFAAPAAAPAAYPQLSLATSTDLSYNWAGYVAQGGSSYTGVTGRWMVPKVAADTRLSADAAWVGIGGVVSDDLIQAGTQAIALPSGRVSYQAWIERMPDPSVPLPIDIEPGDEVSVDVHQTAPGLWSVTVDNITSGDVYRTQVAYQSSLSSVEWIEEMPASLGGGFIPLDQFGSVRFLSGAAIVDGAAQTIAQAGGSPLSMINRQGEVLAVTSVLSANGGFIVGRSAAQATLQRSRSRYAPHPGIYR